MVFYREILKKYVSLPLDILQQNKIMDLYLTDLLQRIGDDTFPEGYVSSEDIPSWKACREAEKLTNESYIPQLIGYIEQQKDDKNEVMPTLY